MTDTLVQARQIIADLRELCKMADWGHTVNDKLSLAADEIERLTKLLAQKQESLSHDDAIIKGLETECGDNLGEFLEMRESRNKWRAKAMPNRPFNYDDLPDEPEEYADDRHAYSSSPEAQ